MHEFIIKKQGIPSRINILAFLEHLRKEKHDLRYLASIELGSEVWSGVGATKFGTYRIDLETSAGIASIAPTVTHSAADELGASMSPSPVLSPITMQPPPPILEEFKVRSEHRASGHSSAK
jgi:hypothetical protein